MDIPALLRSLAENGEVLPRVIYDLGETKGDVIMHRTEDEVHPCLVCGLAAPISFIALTRSGERWLDLCPDDAAVVRMTVDLPYSNG